MDFFSVQLDDGELYEFVIVKITSCVVVVVIVGIVMVESGVTNFSIICIIISLKSSI